MHGSPVERRRSNELDPGLALATVRLSRMPTAVSTKQSRNWPALGLPGFRRFSGPSTQALIAEDLDAVLGVRGTESTNHIDWLRAL